MTSERILGDLPRRTVLGGLAAAGGLAGLSVTDASPVGNVQAQESSSREAAAVTPSPATSGTENATYTVTIPNIAARGGQSNVDQVALDFRGTGMNFNTVVREEITAVRNPETNPTPLVVTKTRTALTGDQPTIGISRASGQPPVTEGDTLRLRIPGLRNPTAPDQYVVGIRLLELATGQRAGMLDARVSQFTITGDGGAVSGTITSDGEPVPTDVTLTDEQGDVLGVASPDDTGEFELGGIEPGSYDIVASETGFEETTVADVEVSEGETTEAELDLVAEPTAFEVENVSLPETVTVGESIPVETTVTNLGGETGSEDVTIEFLEADGDVIETVTEDVTLDSNESASLEATFGTTDLHQGEYSVRVSTENTATAGFVTVVTDPDAIGVEVVAADTPVAVDENTRVTAVVANDGDVVETQYAECCIDDDPLDDRTVTVGPDASTSVTFNLGTDDVEPGEHEIQVRSGDVSDTATIEVAESPPFEIETVEAPTEITQGGPATVTIHVVNTGTVTGTKTVSVEVNGRVVGARSVPVGPGATRAVAVPIQTENVRPGTQEVTVRTPDDTGAATVTVSRPNR
jgi:uncharacterized membrane protein